MTGVALALHDSATGLRAGPYVGLQAYREEDALFFFGREAETKILSANLGASRLTVLYAESGVGKSSVLRAGVAQRLNRHAEQNAAERGGPGNLPVVFGAWSDDPIEGLTLAIRNAASRFSGGSELPPAPLDETIAAVNERLGARPMIILDQFEEYFRYHAAAEDDPFAEQFVAAVNRPDLRAGFLVAIREDALARLDLFQGRIPDMLANYVRIDHLDRDAARAAIEKPLEVFDKLLEERDDPRRGSVPARAEPELVEEVLRQVAAEEGDTRDGARATSGGRIETPHLQLVLRRLWAEECEAGSPVLRLDTLERVGGARTIIETHLDETMASLTEPERDLASRLFRQFVTPSGAKYAYTISDLVDLTDEPESEISPVLEKLAKPESQILRAVAPPPGRGDGFRYEITHDVLGAAVRDWRRRHEEGEKDRKLAAAEQEARDASDRALRERRRARIFRGLTIASLILLVISVVAGVLALRARGQANEEAERSASKAVGAKASTFIDQDYRTDAALLAALEAYRLKPTFEARQAVLSGLQADPSLGGVLASTWWLSAVAFSPDSRLVATGSTDETIRLWNGGTRASVGAAVVADVGEIVDLAFTDGGTLVSAGKDGVATWDVSQPGTPLRVKARGGDWNALGQFADVVALAYADPTGILAVGEQEAKSPTVSLWDMSAAQRPALVGTFPAEPDLVDVAISPDGKRVAAGGSGGLQVWVDGGSPAFRKGNFSALAFAPDGGLLAAGRPDGRIVLLDLSNPGRPRVERVLPGHLDVVRGLAFNADGTLLVSGGQDNAVLLWDVATGLPLGGPRTHTDDVTAVAFGSDGRFASAGGDWLAKLWRVDGPSLANMLGAAADGDNDSLSMATGGLVAAAGDYGGQDPRPVRLWSTEGLDRGQAGVRPLEPELLPEDLDTYAVAARGDVLAVVTSEDVAVWRVGPGSAPELRGRVPADVTALAISADGTRLAGANGFDENGETVDGALSLWDLNDLTRSAPLAEARPQKDIVDELVFSPDGKLLATANEDGSVRLFDVGSDRLVASGELLGAHEGQRVTTVAFSPDGATLASGGMDNQIRLWDVRDPRRPVGLGQPFPPQSNSILALAFSHDGKVLAAGDGDGDLVLWDVQRRESLGSGLATSPFESAGDSEEALDAIAFAPGDRSLVAAGRHVPVVVWSSALWSDDLQTLRRSVCDIVHRDLTAAEWREFFSDTPFEDKRRATCSQGGT